MAPKVLVIDDEPYISDLLVAALKFEGFEVDTAMDGAEAISTVGRDHYDIILLDVMLPDATGTELCRKFRMMDIESPVLFLTARDATEDKLSGFDAGGDDYVTKPFNLDELVARMRALLRRSGMDDGSFESDRLTFGDLVLDVRTHEVSRNGVAIELTATEFSLLETLMTAPRKVFTKSELLDDVWGFDFEGDPAIVETYISYLRKKVDIFEPAMIHTIRGVGYSLRLPR
ncbi:MAG: response regulator transcription factor [Actinobacteria bacterium]|nr:response regulator transcription factor [Actinomycetota bacterium]MCL5885441.1 response regulator transcription factor [Actinomycetota bacterium]